MNTLDQENVHANSKKINILLFLVFSIGYFLWRYLNFNYLVWDDTSSTSYNVFVSNHHYAFNHKAFLCSLFKDVFGSIQGDGYRPFAAFWKILGIAYFSTRDANLAPFIGINALITGGLASVYFCLARHFLRTKVAALFSVFLLLFSTPILTGLLIVCTGVHVLVALLISLGLLCYFRLVGSGKAKILLGIALGVIMFFGPLFREFIGLLPLLIIILEFQRVRRFNWLMMVSLIFFLHALFPTAVIKWTLFPNLPLIPVFAMGNLGDFMQRGVGGGSFLYAFASTIKHLHWRIFIDVISIYPPTVFAVLFLTWWLKLRREGKTAVDKDTLFLVIFFVFTFLPFLKIFNEQVHLSYSLVPMSILLAASAEKLWFMISASTHLQRVKRLLLTAAIILILSDHILNVYAARKVTQDIYFGIMKSADWFKGNVSKGTYVITNAHHLEDIRFYSGGHIEPWGAPGGIPDQRRWMHNASDLQKMLDERAGRDIYFFDVVIKKPIGQRGEGRTLFYVRDKNIAMADLGILHKTQSRYLFLDPLKYLIPIQVVTWPGPPDLEFDFYRGPSLDGILFHREVFAEYHLYKAISDKVDFLAPPQLLEQNYSGFNIILFNNRVYAIPQPEGAFDLARVEKGGYSRSFQGYSAEEVKRAIDREFPNSKPKEEKVTDLPPQLLEQNYQGFNLVLFRSRVYAIPQPEGAFELARVEKGDYSRSFQGNSAEEVKKAIDKEIFNERPENEKITDLPPQLLEQNYRGFNLVLFRNRVYAIPQPEGAFELERIEKGEYSRSYQGLSTEEVKKAIDEESFVLRSKGDVDLPPQLLEENYRGFNLILFHKQVYAILQTEGAFEMERVERGGYRRVFQGATSREVKMAIDKDLNTFDHFMQTFKRKLNWAFKKMRNKK